MCNIRHPRWASLWEALEPRAWLVGMAVTPWAMERRGRDIGGDAMLSTGLVLLAVASVDLVPIAVAATSTMMALVLAFLLVLAALSHYARRPTFD